MYNNENFLTTFSIDQIIESFSSANIWAMIYTVSQYYNMHKM